MYIIAIPGAQNYWHSRGIISPFRNNTAELTDVLIVQPQNAISVFPVERL